jgi:hypothetical protein
MPPGLKLGHRTVLLITLVVAGCGSVSRDEVVRVLSPDGRVVAVLVETNGGATTSFGYEVRVLGRGGDRGDEVAWLYGAARSNNASGANVRWASDTELLVEYLQAREARLEKNIVHVGGRDVRIALRNGVTDSAAPAGGMLFNLEQKRKSGAR